MTMSDVEPRPSDRALWALARTYFDCAFKGEGQHAEWCPGYRGEEQSWTETSSGGSSFQ